jgi:hypothetical protein
LVKVINLEYGFLESQKRVYRSSYLEVGCGICSGWGLEVGCGGLWDVVWWGMILGDAMLPFLRSLCDIPVFEIHVFEINTLTPGFDIQRTLKERNPRNRNEVVYLYFNFLHWINT